MLLSWGRYAPRVGRLRLAMLYLVGLGLGDAADITVKGLEIVRRADKVFLEAYTSVLSVGKEALVSGARSCSLHVFSHVTRRWSEILLPKGGGGLLAYVTLKSFTFSPSYPMKSAE